MNNIKLLQKNIWIKRIAILTFSAITILSSAASCNFLGGTENNDILYGVLKQDPSLQEGVYGKINLTVDKDTKNADGLSDKQSIKILQNSDNDIYILTKNDGVYHTTDGGREWQEKSLNKEFSYTDIDVVTNNKDIYYISGQNSSGNGEIYKTTDGGSNYTNIYSDIENKSYIKHIAISKTNANEIYAVLENNSIIKSADAGTSWSKNHQFNDDIVQFGVWNNNTIFALLEDDGIATSRNQGKTWNIAEMQKSKSTIGETQTGGGLNLFEGAKNFGEYQKIIKSDTTNDWLLIADSQLWHTKSIDTPFVKIPLPIGDEKANITTATVDPKTGTKHILLSIENKLYESKNSGISWSYNSSLSKNIGSITDILMDKYNNNTTYLVLGANKN